MSFSFSDDYEAPLTHFQRGVSGRSAGSSLRAIRRNAVYLFRRGFRFPVKPKQTSCRERRAAALRTLLTASAIYN